MRVLSEGSSVSAGVAGNGNLMNDPFSSPDSSIDLPRLSFSVCVSMSEGSIPSEEVIEDRSSTDGVTTLFLGLSKILNLHRPPRMQNPRCKFSFSWNWNKERHA